MTEQENVSSQENQSFVTLEQLIEIKNILKEKLKALFVSFNEELLKLPSHTSFINKASMFFEAGYTLYKEGIDILPETSFKIVSKPDEKPTIIEQVKDNLS